MYKYSLPNTLFLIGLLLQFIGTLKAASLLEVKCAEEERQNAVECKKLHATPERVLKRACCAMLAVEKCILKQVDENCKPLLNERYQNSPLRKGDCKPFYEKCDEIIKNHNLIAEEQKDAGNLAASSSVLLMVTCSFLLTLEHLFSRWLN